MRGPLNLAREPFRNERLPTLLLGLGTLALAALTARHALVAWQLLPSRVGDAAGELAALEAETRKVRAEAAALPEQSAPPATLEEWATVRALVDRRVFSWTGLLAALEQTLPPGVRLVSVQPRETGDGAELTLTAQGRTNQDALALLSALQANGDFQAAFLNGWTEGREGVDISCSVTYAPRQGQAR